MNSDISPARTPSEPDDESTPAAPREDRVPRWMAIVLIPALLFVVAVALRLLPISKVVLHRRILLFGTDAYYHMRRIVYSAHDFPSMLDFDPYINFPDGARSIWPPLFDGCISALIWLIPGDLDQRAMELAAISVPPVLGGLTVVAVYFLARRHFGIGVGILAASVLCILSGHFWFSQIGYVDHHSAVALVTTGLLGGAMALLSSLSGAPGAPASPPLAALALGGLLALCLLLWPGSLLHVGLVEVGLLACLLSRESRDHAVTAAFALTLAHGMAFSIVAPASIGSSWEQWSDFSPVVLSNFQPWFFGSAALFSGSCALLWRGAPTLAHSRVARIRSCVGFGLLIVVSSLLLWPAILDGALDAWAWLTLSEAFQSMVAESTPIFESNGHFDLEEASTRLSWFFFVVPLAIPVGLIAVRHHVNRAALLLFLWWTLSLCVATVLQRRFYNSSSIAIALLLACSASGLFEVGCRRLRGFWPRAVLWLVLAAAIITLVWPSLGVYPPYWSALTAERGRVRLTGIHAEWFAIQETAAWIRANTPHTKGWLDTSRQPEYGIVGPWDVGHVIEYIARRPTSSDSFGDDIGKKNFSLVQEYFGAREKRAAAILEELQTRYVVVPYFDEFLSQPPGHASMYRSLYHYDGSERASAFGVASEWMPGLERHRLVYEFSRSKPGEDGHVAFKVYEFVRGARIAGWAAPGAEVRLSLEVETEQQRTFLYRARTMARRTGRYRFRVPYATARKRGAVQTAKTYLLECGGDRGRVRVRARAVERGSTVNGPTLCR